MRAARTMLIAAGVAFLGYGGWLLQRWQSPTQLRQVAEWAAGGVLLHDVLFAPLVAAIGWAAVRWLPRSAGPAATAAVVAGIGVISVSAASFAVLGRSGDGGANTTLLTRGYEHGWFIVTVTALLIATVTTAGVMLVRGARGRRADGTDHGGR